MIFRYTSDEFEQIKPFLKDLFNQCKDDGNFNKYKNVLINFIKILDFDDDLLKDIDECLNKYKEVICLGNKWIEFNKKVTNLKGKLNGNFSIIINEEDNIEYIIGYFLLINYECFYFYIFYSNNKNQDKYDKCKSIIECFEREIYLFKREIMFHFINITTKTPSLAHIEYMENHKLISDQLKEINNNNSRCENLKSEIQNIENRLQNQRQEFNFIGLSNAFQKMKDDKNEELKNENSNNKIFMRCILGILLAKLMWSVHYVNFETYNPITLTVITISSIFIVAILLYFFRISLHNIKAIQSQILQLDLRLSLCQFIHNYATDSKEMRTNMKESLERFESVIFAPIVATDDKIPATLDGMEQLGKLVEIVNVVKKSPNPNG